jgi:hypothetical protein
MNDIPEIATVKDCPKYCAFMSEKALRWKIFIDPNFKDQCTRKVGRRRFMLPREVIKYILNQGS